MQGNRSAILTRATHAFQEVCTAVCLGGYGGIAGKGGKQTHKKCQVSRLSLHEHTRR